MISDVPDMDQVMAAATWFGVALGFITVAIFWMVRVVRSVKSGLERVVLQTENSHHDEMYPNMRDELTATRITVEEVAKTNEQIVSRLEALQEDQAELRREVREDRKAVRDEVEGVREDIRNVASRQTVSPRVS